MSILERPEEAEISIPAVVPEAIIQEARRRERRRRAVSTLAAIGTAGAVGAAAIIGFGNSRATTAGLRSSVRPSTQSSANRAPDALVVWGDYAGVIHLGDLATRRQVQIAEVSAAEAPGLVVFDRGRLLWGDGKGRIRSVDIATGRVRVIARGMAVMASPDGTRLYVDRGTNDFLQLNARTMRITRRLRIPAGWTESPWGAAAVAGGLILFHTGTPTLFGIWHPGSKVKPLGAGIATASVYTAPSGRYSLVAWVERCDRHALFDSHCPLAISNTATGATVTATSPTRYGFTGGAFSPDGTEFATYVNTDNPSDSFSTPRSELAIVNTATGALRLDPKVNLITTEDAAWVAWLPSGRQLLTGAIAATYLVNAHTLAARPFYFDGPATQSVSIMNSTDLNFSTIAIPRNALSQKQRRSLGLTRSARNAG